MNRRILLVLLVAGATASFTACMHTGTSYDILLNKVIDTERSFAEFARANGVSNAFRAFIAPDGILFRPNPVPGVSHLEKEVDPPGAPVLEWWPVHAGISLSGDLAFTTGPWVMHDPRQRRVGQYFTIWKQQPDGSFKFLLDHGPPTHVDRFERSATVTRLPVGTRPNASVQGLAAVRRIEDAIAAGAAGDFAAALRPHLHDDIWLLRLRTAPAVGRNEAFTLLAQDPQRVRMSHLGGGISRAGDLAYTYGDARWQAERGINVWAHYIRMWQHNPGGWKIVVDELLPVPPSPRAS